MKMTMTLFHKIQDFLISLSDQDNDQVNRRIRLHAEALSDKKQKQSAKYYVENRNATASKVINDICLGKKAEVMTMLVLRDSFGFPAVPVDLEIRKGNKKGWMPDLIYPDVKVHVKSCSASTLRICGDYSWTFNWKNSDKPGGKDEIFASGNGDLCAFVFMEDWFDKEAVIKAIVPWNDVVPILKDPVLPKFVGIKHCLYFKDLKNAILE